MSLVDQYLKKNRLHQVLIMCNFPTLSSEAVNYILTLNSTKPFDVTKNNCRFYNWNKQLCSFVVEADIHSTRIGELKRIFRKIFVCKFTHAQSRLTCEKNLDHYLKLEISKFWEAGDFGNFELTVQPNWTVSIK